MKFTKPHTDAERASDLALSVISFEGVESMTQQQFKDGADLNLMLVKFGQGVPMPTNYVPPTYGDFSGVGDYMSCLQSVRSAAENFMTLPARIRDRFKNDPQALLEFVTKPENHKEGFELGLFQNPPKDPAPSVPPAPPPAASPPADPPPASK